MATFSANSRATHHDESWVVVAALRRELSALRQLQRENLIFLETGIGTNNAREKLTKFVEKRGADFVLAVGMAGALSASMRVGDLFIADRAIGPSTIMTSASLYSLAKLVGLKGANIHVGAAVTTNEFVCEATRKRSLAAALGPHQMGCVDMESWSVARVCTEHRIPFLIIRSISDLLGEDLPLDFNRCRDSQGDLNMLKIAAATRLRPGPLKGLWQLRERAALCSQRLAWFVDQFLAIPEVRGLTGTMRPSSNSL